MVSIKKLSVSDDHLETMEPLVPGNQLPPSQPPQPPSPVMFFYIHPSPEQPQPPPPQLPQPPLYNNHDQISDPETELTMYSFGQKTVNPKPQPPPKQQLSLPPPHAAAPRRNRKKPSHAPRQGKSTTIEPPFAWATDKRARVHSLAYLKERNVKTVAGDVECKRCQKAYQIEFNLEEKYKEVFEYVVLNSCEFHDRAPPEWMSPVLPKCGYCHQENCVKPVIKKKKTINWLFLFLGQMLGCCTLGQLKYFCKHTGNHRTGAKDRVLFLTYVELCKQVSRVDEP